ncbi:MAG TPA: NADP-dependent oxidoreductase [Nocardioidaceae bacterium]|nr:NADP-dependent oxidoreductase [Nocardioidaceae bacterium]
MTRQMKAVVLHRFGDTSQLALEERPIPDPGPTEVLVRVAAAGVNPVDWWTRMGEGYLAPPPLVLGWDAAGVVEAVNDGVTLYQPGDEVLGMPRFPAEAGCYAEYIVAPARHFVAKPAAMPYDEAAGLPLAGLTAWQALVDTADVQPGQRVLVTSAAGGVGHLAVQIAKARGAEVVASASAEKHGLVKGLGADEVVDYRTVDLGATLRDLDLVIDSIGGDNSERLVPTLRTGGTIIPVFGGATEAISRAAERHGVRAITLLVEPDQIGLLGLTELIDSGRLRVVIDSRWPLDQVAAAHARSESGCATGKIVLTTSV